jgi:hypothetical protein
MRSMNNRDDFYERVRRTVAARAGWHCSFAGCAKLTVGPSEQAPDAFASIGKAAHICAAAPAVRLPPHFKETAILAVILR